jgi:hypothetical protein
MRSLTLTIVALLVGAVFLICGRQRLGGDYGTAMAFGAMTTAVDPDVITVTIKRFLEISGLSNTTVYSLMNRGEIETVHIGRRRLIVLSSYWTLLRRRRGTPATTPLADPPRPTPNPSRARYRQATGEGRAEAAALHTSSERRDPALQP